ncbi:unnamed protein product [marine sediment metagenome]|uniref:Uncharacterized protein n=1 Tax=marine sediment metagenome TaxID=412755 RepID=X1H676_9ZZZZ
MTLDKAIEILKELPHNLNNVLDYDQQDAINLGQEALKREQAKRTQLSGLVIAPLPGEDSN